MHIKFSLFSLVAFTQVVVLAASIQAEDHQDAPTTNPTTVVGPVDPQEINDAKLLSDAAKKAEKLLADHKLVSCADLYAQLNKTRTKVTLPATIGEILKPDDIYAKRCKSVLIIAAVHEQPNVHLHPASGFIISSDGVAVTNYHVLSQKTYSGYIGVAQDGSVYPVKAVLAASEKFDVALIQLEGKDFTPIPIAQRAAVGSDVYVISNPANNFWYFTKGIVARYAAQKRKTETVDTLAITADYGRGSSGSPILSSAGEVIGLVSSTNSLYYTETKNDQKNLQMVFKNCVTSQQILSLIEK